MTTKDPVAWIAKQEDGGLLLWDASYKNIQEGYDLGFNKSKHITYYPLYLHPTHDDTALLRQALEALEKATPDRQLYLSFDDFYVGCDKKEQAITALRERLGEKVWMNSK